ncbi:FAD-binding oxidoreductase [Acuticoccus sp. MNP-M23]|uniref:NAD(P)/FAD-dependent oxidoreductase n=1 Tax=Acuticoccus sp. MNP-M23 TaxID=3072793 RepID=UPI002814E63A|nr:FAD-binding oxidoreductase [Acuticoccus sp. MNP-M23]WMS41947.1 FAD-binding oxidoreductase [Acuticoccus sp. MNP-M23]
MTKIPSETEVVIIGGGVVGIGAAIECAERGIPCVVCEKGTVAGEQSSRNWGWIRKQGRRPEELPLMLESDRIWRRLAERIEDVGFRVGGVSYFAQSDEELQRHIDWMEHAGQYQIETHILSSAEVDEMTGRTDRRFRGGVRSPTDAYAEPSRAVPALARYAEAKGAVIATGTAVRTLMQEGGRVTGVVTEHGPIAAQSVILAGGAWSRTFLKNINVRFPQLGVRSSAMRTSPVAPISTSTFGASGASIRPRLDGGYTVGRATAARFDLIPAAFEHFRAFLPVMWKRRKMMKLRLGREYFGPLGHHRWGEDDTSPFELVRTLDPAPDQALLTDLFRTARSLYPHLAEAKPVESWASLIDVMPDEMPVIDTVASVPGLVIASGLSGHGFGLGPGAGALAAQLALGRDPIADPLPFRLSRFGPKHAVAA